MARQAGVSRTAASFVLNDRGTEMRIAAETQGRVRRAARELDYRPNFMARSLQTRLTQTIGLLSDCVATDGFSAAIIEGALSAAAAADHMLHIGEFGGDTRLRDPLIETLIDRHVDGFIYAATTTVAINVPSRLRRFPLVMANCLAQGPPTASVIPDDLTAGRLAGEHLLASGHRDGVYLVGETPDTLIAAAERRQGLEGALAAEGMKIAGHIACRWWPEPAFEAVSDCLIEGHRPSAFVCLNDRVAMGAYQALERARLPIPEAVSIVSFDDSMLASWLQPQLTSIALPQRAIGRRAIELVLDPDDHPSVHRLPMQLQVRASVGPPAA